MKRFLSLALLLALVLFSFSACGTSQWKDLGIAFAEDIFQGDYAAATARMDASLQENFTEDTMRSMVDSVTAQYGDFDSVISATVGSDADYPDYKIVKVNVQLAGGKIQLELAYDEAMQLCGVNLLGSEEPSAAADSAKDYRREAKSFLTYVFNGDTASAYGMLNETAAGTYTEENLNKLKEEAEASYGAFDGFGPSSQNGNTVTVYVTFGEGNATISVDFDNDGDISDFSVSAVEE